MASVRGRTEMEMRYEQFMGSVRGRTEMEMKYEQFMGSVDTSLAKCIPGINYGN